MSFISILIGVFLGCALLAFTTKTRLAPDPEQGRPIETRLLLMILGAVTLPIGLFWFAWTSFPSINPWPQIIAGVPIGFSVIVITLQGMNYIIDCYVRTIQGEHTLLLLSLWTLAELAQAKSCLRGNFRLRLCLTQYPDPTLSNEKRSPFHLSLNAC